MNPPIELTEFVPENVDVSFVRAWELRADEFDDTVEVRNIIYSWSAIAIYVVAGVLTLAFAVISIVALLFMIGIPEHHLDLILHPLTLLFFAFAGIFAVWALFPIPSWNEAFSESFGTSLWRGESRMQYSQSSGELFFSRENVRYSRNDYDALFLGITHGYDTVDMLWKMRMREFAASQKGRQEMQFATQSYFLVRLKEGTWARHLIGYDRYSKFTDYAGFCGGFLFGTADVATSRFSNQSSA